MISDVSWVDAGDATGIDAGDAICQAHADRAGLTGNFKAVISGLGSLDFGCRFLGRSGIWPSCGGSGDVDDSTYGPWVRMDGELLTHGLLDLFDGSDGIYLHNPILFDENGAKVGQAAIMSGIRFDGDTSSNCGNWTASTGSLNSNTASGPYWGGSGVSCADSGFLLAENKAALFNANTESLNTFPNLDENGNPLPSSLVSISPT